MAIIAEKLSIANYNKLDNVPVINQDLTASEFTPVENSYYRHTGATTASYTKGVIYFWNGTGYAALSGSGGGTTLNKYELRVTDFGTNYLSRKLVGDIAQQAVDFQCIEKERLCALSRGCDGNSRMLTGVGVSGQNLVNIVLDINSAGGMNLASLYTIKIDGTITKIAYPFDSVLVITYWNYTEIT